MADYTPSIYELLEEERAYSSVRYTDDDWTLNITKYWHKCKYINDTLPHRGLTFTYQYAIIVQWLFYTASSLDKGYDPHPLTDTLGRVAVSLWFLRSAFY
jgi:hypothetical protein